MSNTSDFIIIFSFIISNIFIYFAVNKYATDFKLSQFLVLTAFYIKIIQFLEVIKCLIIIRYYIFYF